MGIHQAFLGGGRWGSLGGPEAELTRLSPFLFLIGTLMRAEGADPLPGGQFMPRLSHSSRQTRTTLQASGRPGAPALGDGLSDRSELAAGVWWLHRPVSVQQRGRPGPTHKLLF